MFLINVYVEVHGIYWVLLLLFFLFLLCAMHILLSLNLAAVLDIGLIVRGTLYSSIQVPLCDAKSPSSASVMLSYSAAELLSLNNSNVSDGPLDISIIKRLGLF